MRIGTLLFSGTDLESVCIVENLDEFWSSADVRGDLPTYAGAPGASPVRRPVAAQGRNAQVTVTAPTYFAAEAAVVSAKALLRLGRAQIVTRRKITAGGNLDTTQTAMTKSIVERWIGPKSCTLLITVETLDGPWYGASEAIAAVGAVTVEGDSPTRAVVATLAAAAVNPVVTNTANGYSFRYVGTIPAGGVTVDILNRRATAVTGGADLSANLRWSKDDPFQLDPGAQTLTSSSGAVSFTYLPAYS